ncbi:MAG: hypothetical protein V1495_07820 [Pseudomonadota bacterium]
MPATTSKNIKTFMIDLTNKPGEIARVLGQFRETKTNLIGTWLWSEAMTSHAIIVGDNPEKTENIFKQAGSRYVARDACWVDTTDQPGAVHDILKKVAEAGVNIESMMAGATGGRCFTVVWAHPGQHEKLCKALGC